MNPGTVGCGFGAQDHGLPQWLVSRQMEWTALNNGGGAWRCLCRILEATALEATEGTFVSRDFIL